MARAHPISAARLILKTWVRLSLLQFRTLHSHRRGAGIRASAVKDPVYLESFMKTYKIAAIPGDGIGNEVIAAGIQVLESLAKKDGGFAMRFEHFDWGSNYYLKHGEMMPADGLDRLKPFDAIYFGAVGSKEVPDHVTLWGLRLNICQSFDQYANVRPARVLPGIDPPLKLASPADLDLVIVRGKSGRGYSRQSRRTHQGLPEEVATEVSVFTRTVVERIQRFAFELAR